MYWTMSNNKQNHIGNTNKMVSSIDWLIKELHISSDSPLVIQAKAMHKYEIEDAYDNGWHHNNEDKYNPIKYYNKTFNNNEEKKI